nr:MAG TPA: hypothetical protein [Caudoviricetes sp.]
MPSKNTRHPHQKRIKKRYGRSGTGGKSPTRPSRSQHMTREI